MAEVAQYDRSEMISEIHDRILANFVVLLALYALPPLISNDDRDGQSCSLCRGTLVQIAHLLIAPLRATGHIPF